MNAAFRPRLSLALLALAAWMPPRVQAQAQSPILWFDSFEDEGKPWRGGTNEPGLGVRPNTKGRKLVKSSWDDKIAWTWTADVGKYKLPGALNINQVFVGFRVYGKGLSHINVEFNDGAKGYSVRYNQTSEEKWFDVTTAMGQARSGASRMPNDFKLAQLKIFVYGSAGTPDVRIDDFILTVMQPAEQLWPMALAQEIKRAKREAAPDVDGFAVTTAMIENAKEAMRRPLGRPQARTLLPLAFGPHAAEFPAAVQAAAGRLTVTKGELPGKLALDDMKDLRALLPYVLAKTQSETVLIAPTTRAWKAGGGLIPALDAKIVSQRCLKAGVVPIWVLPALPPGSDAGAKRQHDELVGRIARALEEAGAPWIDGSFAVKDNAALIEKGELTAGGLKASTAVLEAALKHIDEHIRRR
ncbi:MAG: hypothetical protein M5U26_23590 [Planctomycetota bacterium]|nr:hypothetical protein [Planctomycetota bacterium]